MSPAFRRIVKLQRQILKTIRADVRKALGPQPAGLKRYYEAYKREFRGPARASDKEELLKACAKAEILLVGDYHTFAQSQKAALRLLRELVNLESPLALALEMVPTAQQALLADYLASRISDEEFLEALDYHKVWGFPWEHFKPLLEFAREHQLPVLALNLASEKLTARDTHAARVLAEFSRAHPKRKLFVLYGDLHLARSHLPRELRRELAHVGLKRRTLTIFQNSESLYWKLAEIRSAHAVDVLALGRNRYCIMNAAPWVKLQSYLEWVESSELFEPEDSTGVNLHEIAHDRLKRLAEALGLKLPASLDFTIQTVNDLSFLGNSPALEHLTRDELKAVKYHVLGNRTAVIPGANIIYLASASTNALCEGVSMLAHAAFSGAKRVLHDPRDHFAAAVLSSALAYFGSKILNHKRKCDLEDDFRLLLERRAPRGCLPRERMQRKVAKLVLSHCQSQRRYLREGVYRAPPVPRGPGRMPLFLETTRCLGFILGEKLYASFAASRFPGGKLETLFVADLSKPRAARALYLELVSELEQAPLSHTSKMDLF